MPDTRYISWPPPPEDRNLLLPHIPGSKAWTAGMKNAFPNPLITPVSKNPIMGMGVASLQSKGMPIYYHYRRGNFPMKEFKINQTRGAGFFGENPETVKYGAYAGKGNAAMADNPANLLQGDNIVPVHIKGKIYGRDVHLPFETPEIIKTENEWKTLLDKIDQRK